MNKNLIDQIVEVLLPEMYDVEGRRELIESALPDSAALEKIDGDGNVLAFTTGLVRWLVDYGDLSNGKPAIVALLLKVKERADNARQDLIDELLSQITPTAAFKKSSDRFEFPEYEQPSFSPASGSEEKSINTSIRGSEKISISSGDFGPLIDTSKFKRAKPPMSAPAAPITTPPVPQFSFRLEGQYVSGNEVKCGAEADLIFDYNNLAGGLLAVLHGRQLEELKQVSGELAICIIPKGFTTRDGQWRKIARFHDGAIDEAVRFQLRADDTPQEDSGIRVIFYKAGTPVYEFDLTVRIVIDFSIDNISKLTSLPPLEIDLDEIMAVQEEPRTAQLLLTMEGDNIRYALIQHDDLVQPKLGKFNNITRTSLSDYLSDIQDILKPVSEHIIWNKLGYRIDAPQSEAENKAFQEFLERVATAGSNLYFALSSDQGYQQVLEKINALAPGSCLGIHTDCAFLPWEILYPHHYNFEWPDEIKAQHPLQVQDFWGYRFSIDCLLMGNGEFTAPYRAHQTAQPFISCNFNPTIDAIGGADFKPVTDQETWINQLDASQYRREIRKTGKDIKSMLFIPDYAATVIYLYCHGSNDKPLQENQKELLQLDESVFIEPNMLTDGSKFKSGPIIFLNSCCSGAFSPLAFSTFLTRFREKEAMGLIATNFPVPAAFAAKFGWGIIEKYIQPPAKTLGDILLQERRRLLDVKNPLGLFYSLQCPMGITARATN